MFHGQCIIDFFNNNGERFLENPNSFKKYGINFYNVCPIHRYEPSGHPQCERKGDRPARGDKEPSNV